MTVSLTKTLSNLGLILTVPSRLQRSCTLRMTSTSCTTTLYSLRSLKTTGLRPITCKLLSKSTTRSTIILNLSCQSRTHLSKDEKMARSCTQSTCFMTQAPDHSSRVALLVQSDEGHRASSHHEVGSREWAVIALIG